MWADGDASRVILVIETTCNTTHHTPCLSPYKGETFDNTCKEWSRLIKDVPFMSLCTTLEHGASSTGKTGSPEISALCSKAGCE